MIFEDQTHLTTQRLRGDIIFVQVKQVIPLIIYLQHLVFTFFRFSGIINCMLITFEKIFRLMRH